MLFLALELSGMGSVVGFARTEDTIVPNQGIRESVRSAAIAGLISWLFGVVLGGMTGALGETIEALRGMNGGLFNWTVRMEVIERLKTKAAGQVRRC